MEEKLPVTKPFSHLCKSLRLASSLNFEIEEGTYQAMVDHQSLLKTVPRERLVVEVIKCSSSTTAWARGLKLLQDTKLHRYVFPDVSEEAFSEAARVARNVADHVSCSSSSVFEGGDEAMVTGVRLGFLLPLEESEEKDYKAFGLQPGILKSHKQGLMSVHLLHQMETSYRRKNMNNNNNKDHGDHVKGDENEASAVAAVGGSVISKMLDFYSNPEEIVDHCLLWYSQRFPPERAEAFMKRHEEQRTRMAKSIGLRRSNTRIIPSKALEAQGIRPGPEMGELLRLAEEIAAEKNLFDQESLLQLLKQSPIWPRGEL